MAWGGLFGKRKPVSAQDNLLGKNRVYSAPISSPLAKSPVEIPTLLRAVKAILDVEFRKEGLANVWDSHVMFHQGEVDGYYLGWGTSGHAIWISEGDGKILVDIKSAQKGGLYSIPEVKKEISIDPDDGKLALRIAKCIMDYGHTSRVRPLFKDVVEELKVILVHACDLLKKDKVISEVKISSNNYGWTAELTDPAGQQYDLRVYIRYERGQQDHDQFVAFIAATAGKRHRLGFNHLLIQKYLRDINFLEEKETYAAVLARSVKESVEGGTPAVVY